MAEQNSLDHLRCPRLPLPPAIRGADGSFAYTTVAQRLPDIAKRVIAENEFPLAVIENLEALIEELPNGLIRLLKPDAGPDLAEWAKYVEPFVGQSWLEVPWYFAEAYFYRRLLEATHYFLSGPQQGVDPFALQKQLGLETAMDSIREISSRINAQLRAGHQWNSLELMTLLHFCLWGNRADLSLWPAKLEAPTTSQSQSARHPDRSQIDAQLEQSHILVDATSVLCSKIASFKGDRIDLIIDNAGFELFCDLCLVDFLLNSEVAGMVCLHLKTQPIFVSDAMVKDVHYTLDTLATERDGEVRSLANRLQQQLHSGRLCLREDPFWTAPLAFWEMPDSLRQGLSPASLIFVKGDANYRRLLGDRQWPFTTALEDIACYFPAPIAALRTLKSEVATSLQVGQAAALSNEDPQWLTNGQWGVIQFVERSTDLA